MPKPDRIQYSIGRGLRTTLSENVLHTTEVSVRAMGAYSEQYPPTAQEYGELQAAYDFFNEKLFANMLPRCLITLQRRSRRTYGYFSGARFGSTKEIDIATDEIAMNPAHFRRRTPAQILGTLGHEQCHQWQQHYGAPSRSGYHNREWRDKMLSIGLHPSSTGKPGGKMVGQRVSHYIVPGSPIGCAIAFLTGNGWGMTWYDRAGDPETIEGPVAFQVELLLIGPGTRIKYTCNVCGLNAWAKPRAELVCGICRLPMLPQLGARHISSP